LQLYRKIFIDPNWPFLKYNADWQGAAWAKTSIPGASSMFVTYLVKLDCSLYLCGLNTNHFLNGSLLPNSMVLGWELDLRD